MLQYRLYNGDALPSGLEGFVKAGANIGSVIGQFTFGMLYINLLLIHAVLTDCSSFRICGRLLWP